MREWSNFYKTQVLLKIGEENIFKKYFPETFKDIKLGKKYTNPLRRDEHPGCSFTKSKDTGRIYFNDYAIDKSYDCFSMIMEKYGISFWQALRLVEKDFRFNFFESNKVEPVKKEEQESGEESKKKIIQYVAQPFTEEDLKYWAQYGITEKDLLQYNILSLKNVYVNGKLRWTYTPDNPIFGYEFGPGVIKCYRPRADKRDGRWLSSATRHYLAFYYTIPFIGDLCIITKSFKDALLLNVLGYNAIAPNSESISLNLPQIRALKATYNNLLIFYDNDEVGLQSAKKRSEEVGCKYIYIPEECEAKDITDFYVKYGKEETINLLNKLIGNEDNSNSIGNALGDNKKGDN